MASRWQIQNNFRNILNYHANAGGSSKGPMQRLYHVVYKKYRPSETYERKTFGEDHSSLSISPQLLSNCNYDATSGGTNNVPMPTL